MSALEPAAVTIRCPSSVGGHASKPAVDAPALDWMLGTWHVTHATLPMWKSKRNVRITYTKLPPAAGASGADASHPRVDDLVEYQAPDKTNVKSVHGVSTSDPKPGLGEGWAFKWRGKGMLMIASSNWEILGYGEDPAVHGVEDRNAWIVTYFTKTIFTPAGIDVYSRKPDLSEETLSHIKAALARLEDPSLQKLAGEIFEVPVDDSYRKGKGEQGTAER